MIIKNKINFFAIFNDIVKGYKGILYVFINLF